MQNFKLVSEFITIGSRPFEFVDPTILNPYATNPIVMGEFLELDSASYKMKRGTVNGATVPSFAYYAEQGAYDVQGLGKGPFLYMNWYEAETKIFDATDLAPGVRLMVNDITYGGIAGRRGLKKAAGGGWEIGYVTRLSGNGWLRFMRTN